MDLRDQINGLILEADGEIQKGQIENGLKKFIKSKNLAKKINWEERVIQIEEMIQDVHKKVRLKQIKEEKLANLAKKKLEQEKEQQDLIQAQKEQRFREQMLKKEKIDALKQKKEEETRISEEAYDLMEQGSKYIMDKDFSNGIKNFTEAKEKFKSINWTSEVRRAIEIIQDSQAKYQKYQKLLEIQKSQEKLTEELQKDIETKSQISHNIVKEKQQEEKVATHNLQAKKVKEEEIADQVFKTIEKIEQLVKDYEKDLHFYNKECPYSRTIKVYQDSVKKLINVGWNSQARILQDGIIGYQKKLVQDQKKRKKIDRKRKLQEIAEKEMKQKEISALQKKEYMLRKEQEKQAKNRQEQEFLQKKTDEILSEIEKIEEIVHNYEKLIDFSEAKCPYPKAIEVYRKAVASFKSLGLNNQVLKIQDGIQNYEQKMVLDTKKRQILQDKLMKERQDSEELKRKIEESKKLKEEQKRIETMKLEQIQREQLEKDASAKEILREIEEFKKIIKDYESTPDILSVECPYPKAIELYSENAKKLKSVGWEKESQSLIAGMQNFQQKLKTDTKKRQILQDKLMKEKQDSKELKRKIEESKKLKEEQERIDTQKKEQLLKEQQEKDASAKEILRKIEEFKKIIKDYESTPDILSVECPYPKAIELYRENAKKLKSVGWEKESQSLIGGMQNFQQKLKTDTKKRQILQDKLMKEKQDSEELKRKIEESQKIFEEQKRIESLKKEQIFKDQKEKDVYAHQVLKEIDEFEKLVKDYESTPDILNVECPYSMAIKIYLECANKLKNVGWDKESQRLLAGMQNYQEKMILDAQKRQNLKDKIIKDRQASEELKKKIEESERLRKEQTLIEERKKEQLQREQQEKESFANEVLSEIDEFGKLIKAYESTPDILSVECPYSKAIDLYRECAKKLKNIGWDVESQRLIASMKNYQQKLKTDTKNREMLQEKIIKEQQESEDLKRKIEESQKLLEEQKRIDSLKKEQIFKDQQEKDAMAKQVLKNIDSLEKLISEYESTPNILNVECPYPMAIEVYLESANKLKNVGWDKESQRLFAGMQNYQEKLVLDAQKRQNLKDKIIKDQQASEELKKKIEESERLRKEQTLIEERKKEQLQREQQEKESFANEVLSEIDEFGKLIKAYESTPDILSVECPYSKAIDLYRECAKKLKNIGWDVESQRLIASMKNFQQKLLYDNKKRQTLKDKIIKDRQAAEELKKKIEESQKLLEEQNRIEFLKKEQIIKEQEKKDAIANQVFKKIDEIETYIKEYESTSDLLSLECPYSKAIQIYHECANELKNIGWDDESQRLLAGMQNYEQKLNFDEQKRKAIIAQQNQAKEESINLQQKVAFLTKMRRQKELQQQEELKKEQVQANKIQQRSIDAFHLMEEGNSLASFNEFDSAIEKFSLAVSIFKEIAWENEAKQALIQIKLFKKAKQEYESKLKANAEAQIKRQREMEEIEHRAEFLKQLEKRRKEEEERRKKIEDLRKRKAAQKEIEQMILEDQRIKAEKIKKEQHRLQLELERKKKVDEIHKSCMNMIEQAQFFTSNHDIESAVQLYKKIIENYEQIGYSDGIRLINDTIDKERKKYEQYVQDQIILTQEENERKKEEEKLKKLIQNAKEESERKNLMERQRILLEQTRIQYENQIKDKIIDILENAGKSALKNNYDEALNLYNSTFDLFKEIQWPLKQEQVVSMLNDTKIKKAQFMEKQKRYKARISQELASKKAFENLLATQDQLRKNQIEEENAQNEKLQIVNIRNQKVGAEAYNLLELAENSITANQPYLAIHYFHYALSNFFNIHWNREAEIIKDRLMKFYNEIPAKYLSLNELIVNSDLDSEYELCKLISDILKRLNWKDFDPIQGLLQESLTLLEFLNFNKSKKLFNELISKIDQEQRSYLIEQERKKHLPSELKANKLFEQAKDNFDKKRFNEAIIVAEQAKQMLISLKLEKKAHIIEQEMLRWKLLTEKYYAGHEDEKIGEEKHLLLSEEERKQAIIEERRRKRRDSRRKH